MLEDRDHQRLRRGDEGRRTGWDAETDAADDPAEVDGLAEHAITPCLPRLRRGGRRRSTSRSRANAAVATTYRQASRVDGRCAAGPELGADEAGAPGGDQGKSEKDPHARDVTIPVGILAVESKEESHEPQLDTGLEDLPALTPAGQRLLDAASDLFYDRGIRAVGVDLIAETAGTTKKTLYDRFGSKDALVALYLRRRALRWQEFLTGRLEESGPDAADQVSAVFDALEAWHEESERGCAFVNAYAELGGHDHPALAVIRAEKQSMHDLFRAPRGRRTGRQPAAPGLRRCPGAGDGRGPARSDPACPRGSR